jgi:kinesin family member 3B
VSEDVEEMYAECHEEKDHYMDQIRILQQQMRLKELVIDLFVPAEMAKKVMRDVRWNDAEELWTIVPQGDVRRDVRGAKRPVSASGLRRPTTDFTKTANAMGDLNPRFRSENILSLELDLPERTTFDFEAAVAGGGVQAALDMAFPDVMSVGEERATGAYVAGAAAGQLRPPSAGKAHRLTRTPSRRQRPSSARRK